MPQRVDLTVERNGHSDPSVTSTPAPFYKGAVVSDEILETDTKTQPGLPTYHLQQPEDNADLATQRQTNLEASPSFVPARTSTGDDYASPISERFIPIVSQFGSLELPVKRLRTSGTFSDVPLESYGDIMHSQLNVLISQFEANQAMVPFTSRSNYDLDFHAIQSIVDQ